MSNPTPIITIHTPADRLLLGTIVGHLGQRNGYGRIRLLPDVDPPGRPHGITVALATHAHEVLDIAEMVDAVEDYFNLPVGSINGLLATPAADIVEDEAEVEPEVAAEPEPVLAPEPTPSSAAASTTRRAQSALSDDQFVDALATHGPITPKDLYDEIGYTSLGALKQRLYKLRAKGRAFTDTNGMWHTAKPHTPPIPNAAPSTSTGGADIDTVLVDLVETHGPDSRRGVAASFLHSCLPTALAVAHDVNDIATRLGVLADAGRIERVGTGRYTAGRIEAAS